ncbi:MAG TPA: SDR family oxidoreductase [Frankiaceae bacterium]|jgi:NAD(P)-dependent dehydrogenase (short-subunit alcohol dehydrogenase family)|nr:SDR family oxidoreductase [Frankiaceae bacterium]
MRGLGGRVVLVAGGAGGIGTATSKRLGEEGASVLVADLNADGAAAVAEDIRAAGGAAHSTAIDLRSEESVAAAVALAVEQFGGLDVLHANAADLSPETIGQDSDAEAIPLEVFDRTIAVNLRGHLLCARQAIPRLLERGGGALVFTSSAAAFAGEPERPAYAMAKSGLGGLVRHIASRWGKQGIRANAVAPGLVLTDTIRESLDPAFRDMALGVTRSARLGTPDDIAAMVAFLASDDSSWITGQVFSVDGGAMLR